MSKPFLDQFSHIGENAEAGAECEILTPDHAEPMGIFIKVVGIDSKTYVRADNERTRKIVAAQVKQNRTRIRGVRNTMDNFKMDPVLMERLTVDLLAACTLGWCTRSEDLNDAEHIYLTANEPIEFSQANAKALYEKYTFIREQVDEFIAVRANFLRGNGGGAPGEPQDDAGVE